MKNYKILYFIGGIVVAIIAFCGLCTICGIASSLISGTSTPVIARLPTDNPIPTDTRFPTTTPVPTATPIPINTPLPLSPNTPTPANTLIATGAPAPLPTNTLLPTDTLAIAATPTVSLFPIVFISRVSYTEEYVDIQNSGDQPQDLTGWSLLSEKGNQDCPLSGIIQPGETLRIWARAEDIGQDGYNCGYESNIWNNDEDDPAVLFNAAGEEIDRY